MNVPRARVTQFSAPRQEWAVLICFYNEGPKLRRQLARFAPPAARDYDLVLGDDGSTDGVASDDLLQERGVTARISLPENRGLSANMKATLDWLLRTTSYRGVIFMNGNDKDDPEAIPRFIQKMREGFDYVQGSRFLPGGSALHTPANRLLAIRLVHAPLFSLAARRWMTDTTNGFRAFSRRFLADSHVQIFQPCFEKYELEQYLAWKAIRLGFRACEIPVSRSYPAARRGAGEQRESHTKIRLGTGHLLLLKPLLRLLIGGYK